MLSKANKLEKEIFTLTSKLINAGVSVSQNYPISKKSGRYEEVSYSGNLNTARALKNLPYISLYNELLENKQFNVLLIDGALLQLMYRFEKSNLVEHRLAFYPSPFLEDYQNARETYESDELYGCVIKETIMPFPIRFDYSSDEKKFKEIYHSKSHMTLGEFVNCRIPVSSPVLPAKFISFIMRHFYFEDRNNDINTGIYEHYAESVEETITSDEKRVSYFSV